MDLYQIIMQRRSVRNFTNQPIPQELINQLLDAANNAPSGGNIQPVSVITVQEPANREKLARIVGNQPWVKNAPLSMIFCLDFNRIKRWAVLNNTEFKGDQALLHFLISYADVMCAAQSVVLLAESLGLGSVYVGTIQSVMDQAREAFSIPAYVLPLMVLSLGYHRSRPHTIPKLHRDVITHSEKYHEMTDEAIIEAFDQKYGELGEKKEEYLEKAFIEAIEADKQGGDGWTEWVVDTMTRLEIRNNAEFLFKLRYPADIMVKMNHDIIESMRHAGFDVFSDVIDEG
jgi:FMN reductase [NAD(P)H]